MGIKIFESIKFYVLFFQMKSSFLTGFQQYSDIFVHTLRQLLIYTTKHGWIKWKKNPLSFPSQIIAQSLWKKTRQTLVSGESRQRIQKIIPYSFWSEIELNIYYVIIQIIIWWIVWSKLIHPEQLLNEVYVLWRPQVFKSFEKDCLRYSLFWTFIEHWTFHRFQNSIVSQLKGTCVSPSAAL